MSLHSHYQSTKIFLSCARLARDSGQHARPLPSNISISQHQAQCEHSYFKGIIIVALISFLKTGSSLLLKDWLWELLAYQGNVWVRGGLQSKHKLGVWSPWARTILGIPIQLSYHKHLFMIDSLRGPLCSWTVYTYGRSALNILHLCASACILKPSFGPGLFIHLTCVKW